MLKLTPRKLIIQLKVVVKHKYFVYRNCAKAGIRWRGIKHDMSKFGFTELFGLARGQTGEGMSPVNVIKREEGHCKAWQHHKGHNKHHYEYWTDNYSSGTTAIKMPFKDAMEMFCDWMGAGQSYDKDWNEEKAYDYWVGMPKKAIHEDTIELLEMWYVTLLICGLDVTLKQLKKYKKEYEQEKTNGDNTRVNR